MGELEGKTVVVTGTTAGVGTEIARGLLAKGAHVVTVVRNVEKGTAILNDLKKATGNDKGDVVHADMSLMKSVVFAAREILAKHPRLYALVHNAVILPKARTVTSEGMELTFATNTVAPLIFTRALVPGLVAGAPSRVVFMVGASAPMDLDDPQLTKKWDGWNAYRTTKFGALLVMRHLMDELPKGVVIHAGFPGLVRTPGMNDAIDANSGVAKFILKLIRPLMRTPAEGARAPVWVASAAELATSTGKLWSYQKPMGQRIDGWEDKAAATKLVAEIDRLTAPLLASG